MNHAFISAKFLLIKILLGPVLLLQGWWVRRKTPVLPEPVTTKQGVVGAGPVLRLLVLGDSSAAGVGAPNAEQALLGRLQALLSQKFQVHYQLLAQTGKTTEQMLIDLAAEPVQTFDLVVTALGVNDVTAQVPLNRWQLQQQQLINTIEDKFSPNQIIMSGLPPVGEFPALLWPLRAYMGAYADQLDGVLMRLLEHRKGVTFLSLRAYPKTAAAASDGFHPGPVVYQMWAENIVQAIDGLVSE